MGKKVSVIIPIYNVEIYLEQCITSVIKQTLTEIEIICVNDGTPDNSMDIVNRLAENEPRIITVNKENGGLSSARNAGMEVAKGEYVCFLDSDDLLQENALEILWNTAKECAADDVFYTAKAFYENPNLEEEHKIYKTYYQRKDVYEGIYTGQELFCKMIAAGDFKPSACLQFIRSEFLNQYKVNFYCGIIHEDQLFTMSVMALAKKTCFINEELYVRRVRAESIMTQDRGFKNAYGYFVSIKGMIELMKQYEAEMSDGFRQIMRQRLKAMCNTAASYLNDTIEIEEGLKTIPLEDQLFFEVTIGSAYRYRQQQKKDKQVAKQAKDKIEKSNAYKIGSAITWIPRKLRDFSK